MNDRTVDSSTHPFRSLRPALMAMLRAVTESRTNYWLSYVADLACLAALGYCGWRHATGWAVPLICLCAGVFAFSWVEYAIHRWLFHAPWSFLTPLHQTHHRFPQQLTSLPFFTGGIVMFLSWWALAPLFGEQITSFYLAGIMAGYLCYGTLHHLEHSARVGPHSFRWLQHRRGVHWIHHRHAHTNFGVTSAFWDRVFGTGYRSKKRDPSRY